MSFLDNLIAPISIKKFIDDYWNNSFLKIEGSVDKFDEVFTMEKFKTIVEQYSDFLSFPQITVFKNGEIVNENKYSKKWRLRISTVMGYQEKTSIDLAKLNSLLDTGITIKVSQFETICTDLIQYLNSFSKEINPEKVYVNVLYSTKSAQAFKPHFDEHDVFVLQLHGEKIWELFNVVQDNPIQEFRGKYSDDDYYKGSKETIKLRKGDLLYLPRGMWHNVYTNTESSFHLQFGVRPKTPIDIFYWLQEKLLEKSEFRETLLKVNKIDKRVRLMLINNIEQILGDDKLMEPFFDSNKPARKIKANFNLEK